MKDHHDEVVLTREFFHMLGSFWKDYFPDLETLISGANGVLFLKSDLYSELLDMCLASSLLDLPVEKPIGYDLLLIQEEQLKPIYRDGEFKYFKIKIDEVKNIDYLTSSLFEPEVTLESGEDFEIKDGYMYLYVDLFEDPDIFDFLYRAEEVHSRHVVLWGVNIVLKDDWIYQRFGRFLYPRKIDSYEYKWLVSSLLYFFTNTKSVGRIEDTINILFGAPFSKANNEIVKSIEQGIHTSEVPVSFAGVEYFDKIKTSHYTYYSPNFFELQVQPGQVLKNYQVLSKFPRVMDYISDPEWYDGAIYPIELISNFDIDIPEVVLDVQRDVESPVIYNDITKYHRVETTLNDYYVPAFFDIDVEKGQELKGSSLFGDTSEEPPKYEGDLSKLEDEWQGIENFKYQARVGNLRVYKEDEGWKKNLYDLIDKILKYNLIYIRLDLNFDSYRYFRSIRDDYFDIIRHGIPIYLHTVIDTILHVISLDTVDLQSEFFQKLEFKTWKNLYKFRQVRDYRQYKGSFNYDGQVIYLDNPETYNSSCKISAEQNFKDYFYKRYRFYNKKHRYNKEIQYNVPDPYTNKLKITAETGFNSDYGQPEISKFQRELDYRFVSDYIVDRNKWHDLYNGIFFYDGSIRYNRSWGTLDSKLKTEVEFGFSDEYPQQYPHYNELWKYDASIQYQIYPRFKDLFSVEIIYE